MNQEGGKRRSSRKTSKASKKSKTSKASRRSSKGSKASRKSSKKPSKKMSKKARRDANPQITVRGALVKYVWNNLDVKAMAAKKNMAPIGLPAKIVNMVFNDAMKDHPMKESDKKNPSFWSQVQNTAMKLLKENLEKYAAKV